MPSSAIDMPGTRGGPIGFSPFSAVPPAFVVPAILPFTLSAAQIRSGSSVPVQVLAGKAGFKHIPLLLSYSRNQTPNVNYVTAQTWNLYYANAMGNILMSAGSNPNLTNVTGAAISQGHSMAGNFGAVITAGGGQALMIKASVDATLGGPDVLWVLVYVSVPVAAGT